jgi:hypothetical protein
VDVLDAMVTAVRARGTTLKLVPFSASVCRMVVVLDSEGHILMLHQATREW